MYTVNRSIYAHLIVEWINTVTRNSKYIFIFNLSQRLTREINRYRFCVNTGIDILPIFYLFVKKKKNFETITSKTWKLEITYLQVFKLEGIGIREVYFNSNRRSTSIAITTTIDCWYVDTIERYNLRLLRYLERFVRRNIGRDRCKSWD